MHMLRPLLLILLTIGCFAGHAHADPGSILSVRGKRPDAAVICRPDRPRPAAVPATSMQAALLGVLDDFSGRRYSELFACFPLNPPVTSLPEDAADIAVLHLARRDDSKRVRLLRTPDGRYYATEVDIELERARTAELNAIRFSAIEREWFAYRGDFEEPSHDAGTVFELKQPLSPGDFTLDATTLKERFYRRSRVSIDPMSRELEETHLYVRLPRDYHPRRPAGLLVWVSPTNDGTPPRVFDDALDEFNVIVVGAADSGNNQHSPNRYQLALDGVANCTRRFHVDPERIYITGLSGGGRVSSMLWGAFPDVFRGCIPIVGLNSYKDAPAGGARHWPADYQKPTPRLMRLLRDSRLAPMTGPTDFNHANTMSKAKGLERDGMDVRVFEYADMGHTLPTAERFVESLRWIDEPARERRAKEAALADRMLERILEVRGQTPPDNPGHRRQLEEVIESGPWSDAAWQALELIRETKGESDS